MYLGPRLCAMKSLALVVAAGLKNYAVVATNVRRYERRLEHDAAARAAVKKVVKLLNCEI